MNSLTPLNERSMVGNDVSMFPLLQPLQKIKVAHDARHVAAHGGNDGGPHVPIKAVAWQHIEPSAQEGQLQQGKKAAALHQDAGAFIDIRKQHQEAA